MKLIQESKNTHFPKKAVKFIEKKHKKSKWMTYGILNFINKKDRFINCFLKLMLIQISMQLYKLHLNNTEKLSDVALKKPKNYTITERFCCIKLM